MSQIAIVNLKKTEKKYDWKAQKISIFEKKNFVKNMIRREK